MAANDEGTKTTDWEGGSLDDLLGLLAEGSWSARIEATAPSGPFGIVDVVAGGVAESHAGDAHGDAAVAAMRARPDLSYRIHLRLPNPRTGGLEPPGPSEGSLSERSVASLMRYCEDFVLSCALVLTREGEVARIVYKRGEIGATLVDGADAPHRLPDVMGWKTGSFRIDEEGPTLRRRTGKRPIATSGAPTTLFGYAGPTQAAAMAAANAIGASANAGPTTATAAPTPAASKPGRPGEHATPKVGLQAVARATAPDRSRPTPKHPSPAMAASDSAHPTPKSGSPITPVESTIPAQAAVIASTPPTPLTTRAAVPTAASEPPPARPRRNDWIAGTPAPEPVETGLLAAPVIVHALLGVALGGLIVVAYWIYLRNGGTPLNLG
ncbi:MAG TPA: hypothetical protein VGG33_03780 [Polyangia bacterium]